MYIERESFACWRKTVTRRQPTAVSKSASTARKGRGAAPAQPSAPSELAHLRPTEFVQKHGTEELRRLLEHYTTKDLLSYVREEKLSRTAVSSLTKDDAINRILGAAKRAA